MFVLSFASGIWKWANFEGNFGVLFWILRILETVPFEIFWPLKVGLCRWLKKKVNPDVLYPRQQRWRQPTSPTQHSVSFSQNFNLHKVQRADLLCDVIRKFAPFVLSKLWILVADWSMHWSFDTFLIKLRLYRKTVLYQENIRF